MESLEQKVRDLITGYSEILSNNTFKCKVSLKDTHSNAYFVKIRVNDRVTRKLILWSVLKIENIPNLIKLEAYLKYLEEDFCNENKSSY